MDNAILWGLLFLGLALLIRVLTKPPVKEKIIVFLLKAYLSIFLGVIVVEEKMLEYPVRFLSKYFDNSLVFEFLLFPTICVVFFHTSLKSSWPRIFLQCFLYTFAFTAVEAFLEHYTNLVKYKTWTWMYTFLSIYIVMIFVRFVIYRAAAPEITFRGVYFLDFSKI